VGKEGLRSSWPLCPYLVLAREGQSWLYRVFVPVQVGDYSFPLELVKQLKNLQGASAMHPRMRSSTSVPVCSHPKLPAEFAPLCASPGAETDIRKPFLWYSWKLLV
uniref:Guanylate cyclase activator 2B n=1 Tax=Varanus komodoensis TaxID=61221 RepID=A0A8D2LN39_VARKO